MQKVSIKKLSVLGLVLMAASAVTAAFLPNKPKDAKAFAAGSLTRNTGDLLSESLSWTCSVSDGVVQTVGDTCTATTDSETTGANPAGNDDSTSVSGAGIGNTTGI